MEEPRAERPHMPGYGIVAAHEGSGLLPWSWAVERLTASHNYWVTTVWPDGRPHIMPVWGVWLGDGVWFSSGLRSRKTRNLLLNPHCSITTDNPFEPVVLEGTAARALDLLTIAAFAEAVDVKYGTEYGAAFYDPAENACFRVHPRSVFALDEKDFTGTPTRWEFVTR